MDKHSTCLWASEGPFCKDQAETVLKALTTDAAGMRLKKIKQHTHLHTKQSPFLLAYFASEKCEAVELICFPPLQKLSIGFWVEALLAVVTDVHQYLMINGNGWAGSRDVTVSLRRHWRPIPPTDQLISVVTQHQQQHLQPQSNNEDALFYPL